ncbi:DUF2207 domain-containing protein, partial [Candidatus Micrarchaeota archaeon]|nr:DUF2207 domain-containing protein [Candidatus Micrarchaeota archaeon]
MKRFLLLALVFLAASAFCEAKSFYFSEANLYYDVADDASVSVREELTFDFSGSYAFAYRDLPDGPWQYSDVKVFEKTDGAETSVTTESSREDGYTRVTWYYNASDERKTFVITYALRNAIVSYDDAYDFYWKAWGEGWDAPVSSIHAVVTFPRDLYSGTKVWVHPDVDATYSLRGNVLSIEGNNLPARTFVEFRALFNKEALAGGTARVVSGNGYDKVVEQENTNSFFYGVSDALLAWPVIVLIALAAAFYYCYGKYGREPKKAQERMERDFLFDDKPWEVEFIVDQGVSVKSMTATLLDLARRGHVKLEKTVSSVLFFKSEDYLLTRLKGKDGLHSFEEWLLREVFRKKKPGLFSSGTESCDSIKLSEVAEA